MKHKYVNVILTAALLCGAAAAAPVPAGADGDDDFRLTASKAVKVARVTGRTLEGETAPNPNQTADNYGLTATDLGIVWDATTDPADKKVMIAFGDSYDDGWGGFGGGGAREGWRSNLLALSRDADLSDGLTFSSMIADPARPNYAKEIIHSAKDTSGASDFTAIPTAGVTVGSRHYIHYMQIKNWGANGRWNTNFSEIAYSDDEGETWTKSGTTWAAGSKFAQAAYAKEGGYAYMFGTPAGRFDSAYLARVPETELLSKERYEYWNGSGWVANDEAAAAPVVDVPVSELSVAYNAHFDKWVMTYLNENRYAIVMRSASELTGPWSAETEVVTGADHPGLYGGFIHPWTNDGADLYMLVSEWGPYNVILMRSTLSIGEPAANLVADPSFEAQTSGTVSAPWTLEAGNGGIDRGTFARGGRNNVWLRNASGWNAVTQTIPVTPHTEYRLKAFVRTSTDNQAGYFGARGSDGSILQEVKFERFDSYSPLTVRFNSGDHASVTIFAGMHASGDTWVQADDFSLYPIDATPPVLTLRGDATMEVPLGGTFVDPGATATDDADGDLTGFIDVEGAVNTNIVGTYTLTYTVSDREGTAAAPAVRTVKVTGEAFTLGETTIRDASGNVLNELPKKGFVAAEATVRNNTAEAAPATFVVALYDKKGDIEQYASVTHSIPSGATETFAGGFKLPGNNAGYDLRVYLAEAPAEQ
ncbi:DUF4185 domain-containing protein [Paenibacillus antri]|uniref:DUF4185 domain-containing protein n=1 Tax=Paenibacillus antri TaxID=2582848 RepID=A0A5R9G8Y7_9BACL|nr:DUF4185 domain-containing protein [Paenibacillus antri]TLS49524.1 DUF4185 domain-containing protein [Paenibacillus antri]